jgi:hypothetical protein
MHWDSERHLYAYCSHSDISAIRVEAEAQLQGFIAELPAGRVKAVMTRLQALLLDDQVRHRVWKGIFTPAQIRWISEEIGQIHDKDRDIALLVSKAIKRGLRLVGVALLAIRKAAWRAGGVVTVKQYSRDAMKQKKLDRGRTGSVATLLGIMSPKESVRWELTRRERTLARQAGGDSKGAQADGKQEGSTQWDVH